MPNMKCKICGNDSFDIDDKTGIIACTKCHCIVLRREAEKAKTRDDGLTEQEGKVADALVTAWNEFCKLEQWHPSDKPCFCEAIHQCQQILAMRIVQRTYPEGWPIKAVEP